MLERGAGRPRSGRRPARRRSTRRSGCAIAASVSTSRRRAVGDDAPAVEEQHPVGVLRGEREVVHRRDERQPRLRAQAVEQLERLLLVPDVERGGRLVEEHDARLLRERARDDDALLLAAGERARAGARGRRAGRAARARAPPRRGRARPPSPSGPRCGVRPRSTYSATVIQGGVDGSCGTTATSRASSARAQLGDSGARRARSRRENGTSRAIARSSVVLPAPFGPMSASHSPSRDRRVDRVDDGAAAELDRDAAQLDRAHPTPPRVVRRTSAKNGAPKNAVTTPSGISAGRERRARDDVREHEEPRADDRRTAAAARGSRPR